MKMSMEQATREMVLDLLQERFPDAAMALKARVSEIADFVLFRSLLRKGVRANFILDSEKWT